MGGRGSRLSPGGHREPLNQPLEPGAEFTEQEEVPRSPPPFPRKEQDGKGGWRIGLQKAPEDGPGQGKTAHRQDPQPELHQRRP